jgi:hypothetical protein
MRLIWHLVQHDIRSQRYALLALLGYLLVELVLLGVGFAGQLPPTGGDIVDDLSVRWPPLLRLLLTATIATLIVQQDCLVGTTAFWRTRPVSRGTLLAGKATTLLVGLVLLPGVAHAAAWATLGLYGADAWRVASGVMVEQATVVLLAVMAAGVTTTPTHAIVAGIAGATTVSLYNAIILPALLTTWPFVSQSLGGHRPTVYVLSLFVLGIPAVVHQYLTLRDWRTAFLVGVALLGATGMARVWPDSIDRSVAAVDPAVFDPSKVSVVIQPGTLQRNSSIRRTPGIARDVVDYSADLSVEGVPDWAWLVLRDIESKLMLRDRTLGSVSQTSRWITLNTTGASQARNPPMRLSIGAALFPATLLGPNAEHAMTGRMPLVTVPATVERGYQGSLGLLSTNMGLLVSRFRVVATSPLRTDARLAASGLTCRMTSMNDDSRADTVTLSCAFVRGSNRDTPILVLRNARLGQTILPARQRWVPRQFGTVGVSGVSSEVITLHLAFTGYQDGSTWHPLEKSWLAGAELVVLERESLGTFRKSLQVQIPL